MFQPLFRICCERTLNTRSSHGQNTEINTIFVHLLETLAVNVYESAGMGISVSILLTRKEAREQKGPQQRWKMILLTAVKNDAW